MTTKTPLFVLAERLENPNPGAYYWSGVLHTGREDYPEVSIGGCVGLIARGAHAGLLGEGLDLWGDTQPGGIAVHIGDDGCSGVDWYERLGTLDVNVVDEITDIASDVIPTRAIEQMFSEAVGEAAACAHRPDDTWVVIGIGAVLVLAAEGEEWQHSPTAADLVARGVPHRQAVDLADMDGDWTAIEEAAGRGYRITGSADWMGEGSTCGDDYPSDDED